MAQNIEIKGIFPKYWDTEKMRKEPHKMINLHNVIADVEITPAQDVNPRALKRLIQLALDSYLEGDNISANITHDEAKSRHAPIPRLLLTLVSKS